jgi:hypothetical protein
MLQAITSIQLFERDWKIFGELGKPKNAFIKSANTGFGPISLWFMVRTPIGLTPVETISSRFFYARVNRFKEHFAFF